MKVGDLVAKKTNPNKLFGLVIRLYEVQNNWLTAIETLPMAELVTRTGIYTYKRRKLVVISKKYRFEKSTSA